MMTPSHGPSQSALKNQFSPMSTATYAGGSSNDNMKVVIRVRPPLARECTEQVEFRSVVAVNPDSKSCQIMEYLGAEVNERER